ncbi:hypothetical protein CAPTEDRAFT_205857 [Capitella teleta]|uniref:Uncharacterized protein n=1 Tax=Capitella teleta TaxID=283909 RepID=R7TQC8_CAPTE|nr:hypothetical protein CAPTEDRAFT_205857 [Capitella teleta]|eukprot:ELT95834.1 hypothetical protein CAPTEDRAFT_205857 [Capitella teleta]
MVIASRWDMVTQGGTLPSREENPVKHSQMYSAEDPRQILVTNQITTRFGSDDVTDTGSEAAYATAALGNSWSHNVNTRFILQYSTPPLRQIRIAKSPVAPFVSLTYTIEAEGLVLQDMFTTTDESEKLGAVHQDFVPLH